MTWQEVIDLFKALVDACIIKGAYPPPEEMTEEEIRVIVAEAMKGVKPWYEEYAPWIIAGGLGLALIIVALRK